MDKKVLSPRSRYGRNQKQKVSQDFYNLDHIELEDAQSYKKTPLPVANNFSNRIPDTSQRKFFKRIDDKVDAIIDVDKVFKIISPNAVEFEKGAKTTSVRTYANKRKQTNSSAIVESFGLPDEPIPSVESPKLTPNRKIDVNHTTPFNQINIDLVFDHKLPAISEIKEEIVEEEPTNKYENHVSTQVKLENEIKTETEEIQIKQLRSCAGTEINGEITKDFSEKQETSENIEVKTVLKRRHHLYHVRFFGDSGRRSWIQSNNILPYHNRNDLEKLNHLNVLKSNKLKKWQRGVNEAESVKLKSISEKLDFFNFFIKHKNVKKMNLEKIKTERNDESDNEQMWKRKISLEKFDENVEKRITRNCFKTENLPNPIFTDKVETEILATMKRELNEKQTDYNSKTRKRYSLNEIVGKTGNDIKVISKNRHSLDFKKMNKLNTVRKFGTDPKLSFSMTEETEKLATMKRELDEKRTDYNLKLRKRHSLNGIVGKTGNGNTIILKNVESDPKFSEKNTFTIIEETENLATIKREMNEQRTDYNSKLRKRYSLNGFVGKTENDIKIVSKNRRSLDLEKVIKLKNDESDSNKMKNSESDTDSKFSENSNFLPTSLESQIQLFKRNNIFRGVSKEKVCQICEKLNGTIFKCTGPCNGYYHLECIQPENDYKNMSLSEQIDFRMKEIMENCKTSYEVEEEEKKCFKHVTADSVIIDYEMPNLNEFKCKWCKRNQEPPCLICKLEMKPRQKCSLNKCGKFYHLECLKIWWPQTQWSKIKQDTFVCPRHVCHTCVSDNPHVASMRCSSDKVVKCLKCPATYHSTNYCVPAGCELLTTTQIICSRHDNNKNKKMQTINTNWCFICGNGGNLICCETCPTSVHDNCLPIVNDLFNGDFYCEDCQSGRLPLYDEIVWVKLGKYRWWPAVILFPNEIPEGVRNKSHNRGEFVVKFYGTYDHYWVGRGRSFLFQEGDKGHSNSIKKRVDTAFIKAINEATIAHQLKREFKNSRIAQRNEKPPPYIRIKVNKPVGNVRLFDGNISNTTSCNCDPNDLFPCGPDSDCLNRLLLTECNPEVCPAGQRCHNQCFEKRQYPPLVPYKTGGRGWGLKTLSSLRKGQFIIEYVGEMINEEEYQCRIKKMHEQKEENYYFLTIDKDRMLDAGPKGNVARFMNHSCQPNCETQKWTVNGDTRVGLFAKIDIPIETELTFNYNLECIGKEMKICHCGAKNCTGFIGVKIKSDDLVQKAARGKIKKKRTSPIINNNNNLVSNCFICNNSNNGDCFPCNNKQCNKFYHLKCISFEWTEKWICPWHYCKFCSKRTIRCCSKCINSYCPTHAKSNIRYDKLLGFVCTQHDPETKEIREVVDKNPITSTPLKNNNVLPIVEDCVVNIKRGVKRKRGRPPKRKLLKKLRNENELIKNTANLFNNNEIKVNNVKMPTKYLRTTRNNSSENYTFFTEKDLPIRKRTKLRCENTL